MTTAVLSLTLVGAASIFAQEPRDQQEEQKNKPDEKTQPAAKQDEKNAQQQDKNTKQDETKYTATAGQAGTAGAARRW